MWKNCAKFNEPGSEVAQLGLTARGVLQELWSSEGLPPLPSLVPVDAAKHVKVKLRLPAALPVSS